MIDDGTLNTAWAAAFPANVAGMVSGTPGAKLELEEDVVIKDTLGIDVYNENLQLWVTSKAVRLPGQAPADEALPGGVLPSAP